MIDENKILIEMIGKDHFVPHEITYYEKRYKINR
ncbi:hypothetical protein PIL02S_06483 [Paenibacillus illinoisensis]|uniref:Uncharacterized protein n=1 Tax=Paenibacillus illinoisensis TaxID=59845 RepID=A0A2W0CBD6_9BACL|nr:hypothetical protein PIL02S_06483 [Paenibacillus illinoisensis]